MKSTFYLSLLFAAFLIPRPGSAIDAVISSASFKSPQAGKGYFEIYLYVLGNTVQFLPLENGRVQAGLRISVTFSQGGVEVMNEEWKAYSQTYDLASPKNDLVEQRVFTLPYGAYLAEIKINDLNQIGNDYQYSTFVEFRYEDDKLQLSDIEPISSYKRDSSANNQFSKFGYVVQPKGLSFFSRKDSVLQFYAEAYHTDSIGTEFCMVRYALERDNNKGAQYGKFGVIKKIKCQAINALLLQLPIKELPSGNYKLVLEIRDINNNVLQKKSLFFQRSNPEYQEMVEGKADKFVKKSFVDTLSDEDVEYCLMALKPILKEPYDKQLPKILDSKDMGIKREFLLAYWLRVDPYTPAISWEMYMESARYADNAYAMGSKHGFNTDRGYVYLNYGKPDNVTSRQNDLDVFPYEIWEYYRLEKTNQSQVEFVFYNPNIAPDNLQLLHSNARGEVANVNWRQVVQRRGSNRTSPTSTMQNGNNTGNNNSNVNGTTNLWDD